MNKRGRTTTKVAIVASAVVMGSVMATALPAAAHAPHHVDLGNGGEQVLAEGRNHGAVDTTSEPGLALFCVDAGEQLADGHTLSGAMYGIETAHHGPDAGQPGRSDGCYATTTPITDNNPAID